MSQLFTSSTIPLSFEPHDGHNAYSHRKPPPTGTDSLDEVEGAPLWQYMLAGGLGGVVGDSAMHSLDTVKTRQQGFPYNKKYKNMIPAYRTILKEEGFFRGLYGGYTPAALGSFPSTAAFFGTYEFSKRKLIDDFGVNETLSYFTAGVLGDLASSVFYVPSEVLKTRLQLQGKYNNPYTRECGYNYRGLWNAIISIYHKEGLRTFFFGYKETLFRDLPFSALQLTFYERFRQLAIYYNHGSTDLPVPVELFTGAAAGGFAGVLTTPLDVIKTRIQTATNLSDLNDSITLRNTNNPIVKLFNKNATLRALVSIYRHEGIFGAFSGVGPRFIWTGIQSSIMLLLYQVSLKQLDTIFGDEKKKLEA
ncbi:Mitochondrial carrier family protein [Candida parapsilosis]|uniref:Mitochondrial thiamine pyrophosphate carrier 1 n=1 Tax=Candida parapsilosis TaxID=5480 RepID=A0A8X7NJI8_CANPA|nr:Mitochondrial carrier family protein [Candida parapsilosis]KAF6047399.1 Mitochondrial carrier family protein [Candida parapsilosis]KAF6050630.1 Mitochondrial carrier family protein [Candida parapsilosis]KAF6061749.1 Mitochondrial carrier family protein [Candida parapsilosis]KAI5902436.1 Mitochondrial magnesium exporter 1 [Candida parapsilosis]